MLSFFRRRVGARLALIWLAVLVPLSVVLLLTYAVWYSVRIQLVEQERQGYAQTVAAEFELLLDDIRYDMRTTGADIADGDPASGGSGARLRRLVRTHPAAYVAFVDETGRVLGTSDREVAGSSLAGDDALRAAAESPDGFGIEPSEETSDGLVGFHVAQRIPGRPGREPGVMLMFVDVRRLHDAFPVDVPFGGIGIVDSAGQVVFQNETVRFAETRARWGGIYPFWRRALGGEVAVTRDFRFPTGGTRIGAFLPIESIGWAAGSSVPPGVALAPFYRALAIATPALALVGALAVFISIGTASGIRRSLDELSEDAARIGSGDLDRPVRAAREDEIGGVARSLETARVELLETRQRAEQLYEAERERGRFGRSMVGINADLASSLDIEETLPRVLEKVCSELGGMGAVVAGRTEGGWRIRHVLGMRAGGLQPGASFPEERTPTLSRLLRTREPYVVHDVAEADDVDRETAERVGYRAYATYPLVVRDELIGAMTVLFAEARSLSAEELDYLRRVAFAVSLGEENSRLYEAEHRIAETLQAALLALPDRIPGIDFAHLYRSATETARVGGDFYDLFEIEHDKVGVIVGDLSGHGIDAAAFTSLMKASLRAHATEPGTTPAEVMEATNKLLFRSSPAEVFATVFFGVLDRRDGRLAYCNAGHTTAACIGPDGGVRTLAPNSPLVGAFPVVVFADSQERLAPGDLLFLYTDGLTEARRGTDHFGESRLFDLLTGETPEPRGTVQRVLDATLAFTGGTFSDDLAILAVMLVDRG